jgi:glycosyltransferase involved in cell wall biosynthesis
MRLGIDASNIRDGGGLTHLCEMLQVAQPKEFGIKQVIVWGGQETLKQISPQPWLKLIQEPLLDRALPFRLYWKKMKLSRLAAGYCDYLYVPGSSYSGGFRPFVTFSQNMLPFERAERQRYGLSLPGLKMLLLRWEQSRTFQQANGVVFLTEYARSVINQAVSIPGKQAVIPYGINARFFLAPRVQKPASSYSPKNPFKLLYVSKLEPYKHQWHVVEAVAQLHREGAPVALDLIGAPEHPALQRRLLTTIKRVDAGNAFIHYHGHIPYRELADAYHQADGFIFASSCENLPNILLEAMAAGLPIASSSYGPMPEVLGEAGAYFDPEQPESIAAAARSLVTNHLWRAQAARLAYERAKAYSWARCAHETFSFLVQVAAHAFPEADAQTSKLAELSNFGSGAK